MRVTAETKAATRDRILEAAQGLFAARGFDATTTRDIAQAAEIATGTLFNYFSTKEAIVASLASEAVGGAHREFERGNLEADSFDEELFAFVSAALRKLKPMRKHLPGLFETTLSPLAATSEENGHSFRVSHLEAVTRIAKRHGFEEMSPLAVQLYWTLYTSVLVFWASDKSPKQEDTLALLDHSLEMFSSWLTSQRDDSLTQSQKK